MRLASLLVALMLPGVQLVDGSRHGGARRHGLVRLGVFQRIAAVRLAPPSVFGSAALCGLYVSCTPLAYSAERSAPENMPLAVAEANHHWHGDGVLLRHYIQTQV